MTHFHDSVAERIVATLHEPLLVLDEELRVLRANPAFARTFELTDEEIRGRPVFELDGGRWDVRELRSRLGNVVSEDIAFDALELELGGPGPRPRIVRVNGRTLRREEGESRRVLLAIEDVTERHELEAALRQHARELERSNADLEQFAYAASHDLQEPLRMVTSYLQLFERRYGDELEGEAREFVDYAVDGAERMKSLVDGLLQFSRVGRKEGTSTEVDLDEVLDDVLEDLGGRIQETGGTIDREPLPTAYGNRDQLRRVLQNLVDNALTYRGESAPRIEIRGTDRGDGSVHVVLRDHGPGIPEAHREKVFQIFQQLDPHGEGRSGSGIGLALCRKIIERHDGRIWIESAPGGGSTFHFTLGRRSEEES